MPNTTSPGHVPDLERTMPPRRFAAFPAPYAILAYLGRLRLIALAETVA